MGACRETADIWWYLFKHPSWLLPLHGIKRRILTSPYFWHDSFGRHWNRLLGCRLLGHRNVQDVGDCGHKEMHCFNCEQRLGLTE